MVGSTLSAWLVTVTVTSKLSVNPCSSVATTAISYRLSPFESVGFSKSGGLVKVSTPRPRLSLVMVKAWASVPVTDQVMIPRCGSLAL